MKYKSTPSLERSGWCARAVKVNVLPFGVTAVPHAGLFRLAAARSPLAVDELGEADVGDAGSIFSDQMHVRVQDGGVDGLTVLRQHCKQTHILAL